MLCYVTPKEHLGLPNREDVKVLNKRNPRILGSINVTCMTCPYSILEKKLQGYQGTRKVWLRNGVWNGRLQVFASTFARWIANKISAVICANMCQLLLFVRVPAVHDKDSCALNTPPLNIAWFRVLRACHTFCRDPLLRFAQSWPNQSFVLQSSGWTPSLSFQVSLPLKPGREVKERVWKDVQQFEQIWTCSRCKRCNGGNRCCAKCWTLLVSAMEKGPLKIALL